MSFVRELREKLHILSEELADVQLICDGVKNLCEEIEENDKKFNEFCERILHGNRSLVEFLSSHSQSLAVTDPQESAVLCLEAITMIVYKAKEHVLMQDVDVVMNLCVRLQFGFHKHRKIAEFTSLLVIALIDRLHRASTPAQLRVDDLLSICRKMMQIRRLENDQKRTLYNLLGILCQYYPAQVGNRLDVKKIANVLYGELREQTTSKIKSPNFSVTECCIEALDKVIDNFDNVIDQTSDGLYGVYKLLGTWAQANDYSRYGPAKATVKLLTRHAQLFSQWMYKEYSKLYNSFQFWAMKTEREWRGIGLNAVEALLLQVSKNLPEQKDKDSAKIVYKFFVQRFRTQILTGTSTREVALAVKGYGHFAQACKRFGSEEEAMNMLKEVTERGDLVFFHSQDPVENKITYLPQFLEAFSRISTAVKQIPDECWQIVENLSVLYCQHFPLLDRKYHFIAGLTFYRLMLAALHHHPSFIERLIRQILLRIASYPPSFLSKDEEQITDGQPIGRTDPRKIVCNDYLELWKLLLNHNLYRRDLDEYDDFSAEIGENLASTIYGATLRSLLDIIERLDLDVTEREEESHTTVVGGTADPMHRFQAEKPNDFWVFINLVEFCVALLPTTQSSYFARWVCPMSLNLLEMATKHPLVSGFYKLLAACLDGADKIEYFNLEEVMETDSTHFADRRKCYQLFSKFSNEILSKMNNFKDDLLVAALNFLLRLPPKMVLEKLDAFAQTLQLSLQIGLSYLPLADSCLTALELWSDRLASNELEPLYKQVLPYFDAYLRTEKIEEEEIREANVKASKSKFPKGKIPKITSDKAAHINQEFTSEENTRLDDIRWRIALFLGKIGGKMNMYLLSKSDEQLSQECIAWDKVEHLNFTLPFQDVKITVILDRFLPRVCELAATCSNRKTKVSACELLHSIIIFMLGKHSTKSGNIQQREPYNKLYKKVFPVILKLCCDADEVPRQLFQTLMMQIIHWFSGNQSFENEETIALVDSIMDVIAESTDAAIRNYGSECLEEFLKWSLKQAVKSKEKVKSFNANSILRRLFIFAMHPSKESRLGAALAFNAIYRTFREDSDLADTFSFEILVTYLKSLALSHRDDKSYGTQEQCGLVIDHMKRIIIGRDGKKSEYFEVFSKENEKRRKINELSTITIGGLLEWLWTQIGRPETLYRQKCWELIETILPLMKNQHNLAVHVKKKKATDGVDYWIKRFESAGIGRNIKPFGWNRKSNLPQLLSWFDSLEAALDCYNMFLQKKYLSAKELFQNSSCRVFEAVEFFLESVVMNSIEILAANDDHTPKERNLFNNAKCTIVVRILSFTNQILASGFAQAIPANLWSENLFETVIRCCMEPSLIGFDLSDQNTISKLPTLVTQTLTLLRDYLPKHSREEFLKWIFDFLSSNYPFPDVSLMKEDEFSTNDRLLTACSSINGYLMLRNAKLAANIPISVDLPRSIWKTLIESCFHSSANLQDDALSIGRQWPPLKTSFANSLVQFALVLGVPKATVISDLLDRTPVVGIGFSSGQNLKGKILSHRLLEPIAKEFARDSLDYLQIMIKHIHTNEDLTDVAQLLCNLLDLVAKDVESRQRYGKTVNENIANHLMKFGPLSTSNTDSKLLYVRLIQKMTIISTDFIVIRASFDERSRTTLYQIPPTFEQTFDAFCRLLVDTELDIGAKNKVLVLLSVFALVPDAFETKTYYDRLEEALNLFVLNHFPLRSTEFDEGTTERAHYVVSMRKLLYALSCTDSPLMLQQIISIVCREPNHILNDDISYWISRYSRRLLPARCQEQLKVPLKLFLGETNVIMNDELRLNAFNQVLLPMLNKLPTDRLTVFFIDHAQKILAILEKQMKVATRSQLTTKLGCFKLFELMYNRLDPSVTKTQINDLCLQTPNDKSLIKKIGGIAREARREGRDELNDSERHIKLEYRCSAHNCLIAAICATQTESKFYENLLFQKEVWSLIVDLKKKYCFATELETYPRRKKQLLALRRSWKELTAGDNDDLINPLTQGTSTLQFMSSQVLAGSSMNSESSQFDFTATYDLQSGHRNDLPKVSLQDSKEEMGDEEASLEMEMDKLNENACMQTVVGLIKHLAQKGIAYNKDGSPYDWMEIMLNEMKKSTYINVKMFIARIVCHCNEVFRPFAKLWYTPLMKLILDPDFGMDGLHYFRVDLVILLLDWSQNVKPTDQLMMRELLEYLIKHTTHNNSQVLLRNIRLVGVLCELWKDKVQYKSDFLCTALLEHAKKKNFNYSGPDLIAPIQLAAVLLKNGISPLGTETEHRQIFYDKLLPSLLKYNSAKIYRPASELIGLAYSFLDGNRAFNVSQYTSAETILKEQFNSNKAQIQGKFVVCLYGIQRHFGRFVINFKEQILFMLSKSYGDFKLKCMEMCCNLADKVDNLLPELTGRNFVDILNAASDPQLQLWALKTLYMLIRSKLTPDLILEWLRRVISFYDNTNSACRMVTIDTCIMAYQDFFADTESEVAKQITEESSACLLRCLSDPDPAFRQKVYHFWSHESRLHDGTTARLCSLINQMYHTSCDKQYLSYCTYLLLERCSKSPDFSRPLFDDPLEKCHFEDLNIVTHWRRRNASLQTPLFAESQATQGQGTMMTSQTQSGQSQAAMIKATQMGPRFTQTQQGGSKHYDWVSGNTFDDTFASGTFLDQSGTMSDSVGATALLFERDVKKKIIRRPNFGQRLKANEQTQADDTSSESLEELNRLKRRIVKDRGDQTKQFYAKIMTRRKRKKEMVERELKEAKEQNVHLYRRYRKGDFPDVQIEYSALIAPLQSLAQLDSTIAGLLFESLLCGIFDKEIEKAELGETLKDGIEYILSQQNVSAPIVGALLSFSFREAKFIRLDSAKVTDASLSSFQQHLAIILLEKYLIIMDKIYEPPSKRQRTPKVKEMSSVEVQIWSDLARLYKSLGEFDNVRAIFESKLNCAENTKLGLESEFCAQYQKAIDLYGQALRQLDDDETADSEETLLLESRLKCLNSLCQWNELSLAAEKQIDNETKPPNLDEIWGENKDDYCLYYLMRSKYKLLIEGESEGTVRPLVSTTEFSNIIDRWMTDNNKRLLLETQYSYELALGSLHKSSLEQAESQSAFAVRSLLSVWPQLSSSMQFARQNQLSKIESITELKQFLAFYKFQGNFENLSPSLNLCNQWRKNMPDFVMNSLESWDDIVTNRTWYTEQLIAKLITGYPETEIRRSLLPPELYSRLDYIQAAALQRNFGLAENQMKTMEKLFKFLKDPELDTRCCLLSAKNEQIFSYNQMELTVSVEALTKSIEILDKCTPSVDFAVEHKALKGVSLGHLFSLFSGKNTIHNLRELSVSSHKTLTSLVEPKTPKINRQELVAGIFRSANKCFSDAFEMETRKSEFVDPLLAYADFCDSVLRLVENGTDTVSQVDYKHYPSQLVRLLLRAMKMGSHQARQKFPRLLSILEQYPETGTVFKKESSQVPGWMFLGWLNQIVAVLDQSYSFALHDIVSDISEKYPQALIYPFRLSSESYKYEILENRKFLKDIEQKLSHLTAIDRFVKALQLFDSPVGSFTDFLQEMNWMFRNQRPVDYVSQKVTEFCRNCFFLDEKGQDADHPGQLGPYWTKFRAEWYKKFCEQFYKLGRRIPDMMSNKEVLTKFGSMKDKLKSAYDAKFAPKDIKQYSVWLANFAEERETGQFEIELPGQYTGDRKPQPEYHCQIIRFDPRVRVMSSMRAPKVFKIFCNDGTGRDYMVKAGEDLRQDERIEQVFIQINGLLVEDAKCKQRQLNIKTYKVIPLGTRIGLVEFVPNVSGLGEFMTSQMNREEQKLKTNGMLVWNSCYEGKCMDWQVPDLTNGQKVKKFLEKYTGSQAAQSLRKAERLIRSDLLRTGLLKLCQQPQHYLLLRSGFIKSHAVICAAHYLLGIGDRHLNNFMIDKSSGKMVGIDFGYAFGTATQLLAVPELVPFRLTKQIIEVMMPIGLKGQFEATMIDAWRVMRNNRHLLINTMEVFAREPSLDWQDNAKRQMNTLSGPNMDPDISFYPKQKMDTIKRKLAGDNPVLIMKEELSQTKSKDITYPFDKVVALICSKGDGRYTNKDLEQPRGYPADGLSVEQQIRCLIEMATDPINMSRIWAGWEPWF